jgi:hypothetical protein
LCASCTGCETARGRTPAATSACGGSPKLSSRLIARQHLHIARSLPAQPAVPQRCFASMFGSVLCGHRPRRGGYGADSRRRCFPPKLARPGGEPFPPLAPPGSRARDTPLGQSVGFIHGGKPDQAVMASAEPSRRVEKVVAYSRSPAASSGVSGRVVCEKPCGPQYVGLRDVADDIDGRADRARDDHGRSSSRTPEGEPAQRATPLRVV